MIIILTILIVIAVQVIGDDGGDSGQRPGATVGAPCELTLPDSDPGRDSTCRVLASDTSSDKDAETFWGIVDCADADRHEQVTSGGDEQPTATDSEQGDSAFRRLHVIDGDDVSGERCELGYNWAEASDPGRGVVGPGPTIFYREGERRITFVSLRLPETLNVDDPNWRTVLQMKQVQPYNNDDHASMLELQVRDGEWLVINDWMDVWSAPAQTGVWTRFAFDITYSRDPEVGSIKVYVDLDDDGDFSDDGEQSPTVPRQTLLDETAGAETLVPVGDSVPSHLRAGLYENPVYSCPPPTGCYIDVDNVQVVAVD